MTISTFDEYMRAVETGNYPESPLVPPFEPPFVNDKGSITSWALGQFGGLAFIISSPRSIRSNHYHKTDWHFLYMLSGVVRYFWRPVGSQEKPKEMVMWPGNLFFTPPMVEHAVLSIAANEILSLSKLSRRHVDHEADVVRVPPLVELENGIFTATE